MAYADWTFHKSNALHLCAIDASSPLVGGGSLHMSNAPDNNDNSICHGYYTASRGFPSGKIRSLIKPQGGGGIPYGLYGFLCMQSQADLSSTSGSCYFGGLFIRDIDPGSGTDDYYAAITKSTAGGLGLPGTGLAEGANKSLFADSQIVAVQLEWQYSTEFGPGTRLILSVGTATDFSDLVEICDATDVSSPLSSSVAEGLVFRKVNTFADTHQCRFDSTRIVQRF